VSGADECRLAPLPEDLDRLLHDLRGPLNAVVLHVQALKRWASEEPASRESLQRIQHELDRLITMLPQAFALCALEMGPPRRLLLRSVVESALDEHARKRVTIEPGPWPEIDGDDRLLVLAMRHLVANALEASGDDGEVRLSVETAEGGAVAVVVRDSGAGFKTLNPKAVVRLMASTKSGHVGSGLLLALRVARLHGGRLEFGAAAGGGGVVRFVLDARGRA
jgi:signal transduction histidine kinase